MDQLIDSRLERQAQATSKQHYLHRDLQGGRAAATGSHLTDKGRTKLDERGLRYVLHHDEMEQKLLEDKFFTIDDLEEERIQEKELREKLRSKKENQRPWCPSRSMEEYPRSKSKRGVQLEKVIPLKSTRGELDSIIQVTRIGGPGRYIPNEHPSEGGADPGDLDDPTIDRREALYDRFLGQAAPKIDDKAPIEELRAGGEGKAKPPQISAHSLAEMRLRLKAVMLGTDLQDFLEKHDADGSGCYSMDEFRIFVRKVLKVPPTLLTDTNLLAILAALDRDGDGTMDIQEMIHFVLGGGDGDGGGTARSGTARSGTARPDEGSLRPPGWQTADGSPGRQFSPPFRAGQHGGASEAWSSPWVDKRLEEGLVHGLHDTSLARDYQRDESYGRGEASEAGGEVEKSAGDRQISRPPFSDEPTTDHRLGGVDAKERPQPAVHAWSLPGERRPGEMEEQGKSEEEQVAPLVLDKRRMVYIDEDAVKKVLYKLRGNLYGTDALTFLSRHDKDGSGTLDFDEFRVIVRKVLKLPPSQCGDGDLRGIIRALSGRHGGGHGHDQIHGGQSEAPGREGSLSQGGQLIGEGGDEVELAELAAFTARGHRAFADPHVVVESKPSKARRLAAEERAKHERRRPSWAPVKYAIQGARDLVEHGFDVTVPAPFHAMESDILLRQHKMNEIERAHVMERERERLGRERRSEQATRASAANVHLRLSVDQEAEKQKRLEAAARAGEEESSKRMFKAKPYSPPGGKDWKSMEEEAEIKRAQRVHARAAKTGSEARPPRLLARSKKASTAPRKESDDGSFAGGGGTVREEEGGRRLLGPEEVRESLERRHAKWEAKMAATREELHRERETKALFSLKRGSVPLEARQRWYERRCADRRARRSAKEEAEQTRLAKLEERRRAKLLATAAEAEPPKSTHAALLKAEHNRLLRAAREEEAAREERRAEARKARADEAGRQLRASLRWTSKDDGGGRGGGEAKEPEMGLREKIRANRQALDEKVRATRPTLIERMDVVGAREKAKARSLKALGATLKDAYDGDADWVGVALADGLLDEDEAAELRRAHPDLGAGEADDFG